MASVDSPGGDVEGPVHYRDQLDVQFVPLRAVSAGLVTNESRVLLGV